MNADSQSSRDPKAALALFHPAVRDWFEDRFSQGPSLPQVAGWPRIAGGCDTLIAAPTGSGKTLAAFLVCIDRFYWDAQRRADGRDLPLFAPSRPGARAPDASDRAPGPEVVYVSPLKALAADIQHNLQEPLEEIAVGARRLGFPIPEIRVALRSGDTPASERVAMLKKPPEILVTTPESLFLMLTAEKSRGILRGVRTVIVDEIHAVARDKRGSHLALSLERLDRLCRVRPARIGLSATQSPIETVARLLVGAGQGRSIKGGRPACEIVDVGHRRPLELSIELPEEDLEAVLSSKQMDDQLVGIARHVEQHQTTLVFVNTRRMAERIAYELAAKLGEGRVASHHGSLSRERRLRVEGQLRAGELSALVATASLELGIDIGPVELVCQMGSPRGLSTFLQRVGRSGHACGKTPKGILYPSTRDELVESVGLLRGIEAGHLDAVHPPQAPLDILAQQIVAACAAEAWKEDDLYAFVCGAAPYMDLSRSDFDRVIEMLSDGIRTGRGRRWAYLHRDQVNGVIKGRRGARLAAITSGGAIPEVADYRVLADPDETYVGSVSEDFAIESMSGDIFLLGSTSWRIRRVESGIVRVVDAGGAPPTIPFWQGEAPARTRELSNEVSRLRADVRDRLEASGSLAVEHWLIEEEGCDKRVARQLVRYLAASLTALGALPTAEELVFERFFDEAGGMQLVVHCPLGARINRALCLALRKKFCKSFNFELQAAANDDALVLSLGAHHSFPLDSVPRFLAARTAQETLAQATLASPMFTARWRWNLNRALTVLRWKGGKRNPPPIQRMESDDLLAAVFPQQAACQENVTYPIEIPDHPLVKQTLYDCLHEAMDVEGLIGLVSGFESGAVKTRFVDSHAASPLAYEILNGRPFTFLDDAPLEERRTRAVALPRGLPVEARDLAKLDPAAIARVREEEYPRPRTADELHDLLLSMGVWPAQEDLRPAFAELSTAGRVCELPGTIGPLWCATESRGLVEAILPGQSFLPDSPLPDHLANRSPLDRQTAFRLLVGGHLECTGPVFASTLSGRLGLPVSDIELALADLESEGSVLRGQFEIGPGGDESADQFCARRLLTRIHLYTRDRLRQAIQPVSAQDYMRFLLRWQHVAPGTQMEGPRGLATVLEQLQGFEVAAGAWEPDVLSSRVRGYQPSWLDGLCLAGEVVWGRLSSKTLSELKADGEPMKEARRTRSTPSRATPLTFVLRGDLDWLLQLHRGEGQSIEPGPGAAQEVLSALRESGALFHRDLVGQLGRLPVEVEEGLWALVSRGWVTADGYQAVRSLLDARQRWARTRARERARRGLRRGLRAGSPAAAEGRWSLLPSPRSVEDPDALAEAAAEQLLTRWGVVFRDVVAREHLNLPWREVVWALRRMEARGQIRGGRFVSGFSGEQFGLAEAVDGIRRVRERPREGELIRLSAVDPLNLVGILTPGPRVAAVRTQVVVYRDGLPVSGSSASPSISHPDARVS